jgi:hypothetical protein
MPDHFSEAGTVLRCDSSSELDVQDRLLYPVQIFKISTIKIRRKRATTLTVRKILFVFNKLPVACYIVREGAGAAS